MSTVNPFATQIAAQSGASGVAGAQALSGPQNGVGAPVAGDFWQFLFALVGEEGNVKDQELLTEIVQNPEKVAAEAELKLNEGKPLSLPEIAVMLQEQDKEIPIDFENLNVEEIAAQLNELNQTLSDMLAALPPEAQNNPFAEILVGRLQHRLENLQTTLEAIEGVENEQLVALISMGLSPQQITDAVAKIRDVEEKLGRDLTAQDIIAGVGGILTPAENLEPTDQLAAELNEIIVGGTEETDTQNYAFEETVENPAAVTPPLNTQENPVLEKALLDLQTAEPTDELAAQLNALDVGAGEDLQGYQGLDLTARLAAKQGTTATGNNAKTSGIMQASFADLVAPSSTGQPQTLFQSFQNLLTALFDGTTLSADQELGTILPLTPAAHAAHAVTSIPQAGQPHPGTQLVASNLSKMAQNGTPKSMRIELDPPELGRVNVTLEIGPEKTAKVHVLAEKPETFLMLQRDAALLERALQDAGLDANSASLSFELAEDGSAFNPKDNEDGKSGGKRANADTDDLDVIDSTLGWQVDPETGLTSYNLVA